MSNNGKSILALTNENRQLKIKNESLERQLEESQRTLREIQRNLASLNKIAQGSRNFNAQVQL